MQCLNHRETAGAQSFCERLFALIVCHKKAKVNFAIHRQDAGLQREYWLPARVTGSCVCICARACSVNAPLFFFLFFLQSDITSHVVRWLFFLVLPWWLQRKVAPRCSLPRPCARACVCVLVVRQIAFGSKRMCGLGQLEKTAVCVCVCVCVRERERSANTCVNNVTAEFLHSVSLYRRLCVTINPYLIYHS